MGFLVVDNLISADTCDRLANLHAASAAHYETHHTDPFWQDRLLGYPEIMRIDPASASEMRSAAINILHRVAEFYGVSEPLYTDGLHLMGWPEGMHMPVHADNVHANGRDNGFSYRDYSALLYLTDQHEGGGLYLPTHDILIEPRRGMFVSLPAGPSHLHAVTRVLSGVRTTLTFFIVSDPTKADRSVA